MRAATPPPRSPSGSSQRAGSFPKGCHKCPQGISQPRRAASSSFPLQDRHLGASFALWHPDKLLLCWKCSAASPSYEQGMETGMRQPGLTAPTSPPDPVRDIPVSSSLHTFLLSSDPAEGRQDRRMAGWPRQHSWTFSPSPLPSFLPFFFLILSREPRSFKDVHVSLALP